MSMRFPIFADPMYSAELTAEFNPLDVVAIEQKQVALFLRGSHWTTYITLRNGAEYALQGRVADQIRAAQRQAKQEQEAAE
ncbi:hypothetical protein EON83_04300 [bacterium]|nr:MAG: hypothetical protein EON83_04300 [bacterium]